MITVDCGAISQSLIESELFGHVKGAFTGAQTASEGRIVQADGGTLFLDEVGELPLEVQTKLLRFVQEKQITPVGGGKTRQVNVRIVAATNRELAEEVAAGRFRGDLYYRLKVVTIKSPALRERPDDILPLAQHFLEKFAFQYQKGNLHFSEAAETALLKYLWPGNVRELQNTMIHAVVLASSEEVGSENLQFSEQKESQLSVAIASQPQDTQMVGGVAPPDKMPKPAEAPKIDANPVSADDPWLQLRFTLIRHLEEVLGNGRKIPVPIGKWMAEDLVLVANEATDGNARRAAKMLGLAETTFRRQLEKVSILVDAGLLSRTSSWSALAPIFSAIINSIDIDNPQDIIEQARSTLLEQVVNTLPIEPKKGAALLGVTGPPFKRLVAWWRVHSV
jgi:DNA-binding NtrC family response regulator